MSSNRAGESWTGPIQYVFIDETQRDSKRLKITRACESCRRRKVKCDAPHVAQGEPCTSCRRLGVECVLQQFSAQDSAAEDKSSTKSAEDETRHYKTVAGTREPTSPAAIRYSPVGSSPRSLPASEISTFLRPNTPNMRNAARRASTNLHNRPAFLSTSFPNLADRILPSLTPLTDPTNVKGVNTLTEIFGKLNIHVGGRAMFLDDIDTRPLPPYDTAAFSMHLVGTAGRSAAGYPVSYEEIAADLPEEDLALDLIDLYFTNVHPYVPVVNKVAFKKQWMSPSRVSMSPFLLLSLFACAARYSHDPRLFAISGDPSTRGDIWHKLVSRYREEFHDAPRLSTIQAEVINLKALETRPKTHGFLYRGWFLLSCICRMGKDLGLHRMTRQPSNDPDSITGKRIWQVCLIMDQMMGTAQGRELQLNMAEVDLTLLPEPDSDHFDLNPGETIEEVKIQNNFVYMTGLIKILRRCTEVHSLVGIKFPFAAEPQYPALSDILMKWKANLPEHLQLSVHKETRLRSHFIAHLHLTYNMVLCLLHRPWIVSTGEYGVTGEWRGHLRLCSDAARQTITLYELILSQYGDAGILWMIRGNNFAVYGAIIATMIHAVCLTCSEAEFSDGAREYFNRSATVLDHLTAISSTPQMVNQVAVLKELFGSTTMSDARFNMQGLPSELATLQEQYRTLQADQHRKRRDSTAQHAASLYNTQTLSPGEYPSPFQSDQTSYLPAQSYSPMNNPSSPFYTSMPINIANAVNFDSGRQTLLSNSRHSPGPLSVASSTNSWNAPSLAGLWNTSFPITSTGLDFRNPDYLMASPTIMNEPEHQGLSQTHPSYAHFFSQ